jgi:membrane associated rhomboid family serine protease
MAFIPLYDTNPHRYIRWPFVNWALIGVSALVFVVLQHGGTADAARAGVISFGLIPATLNHAAERPADLALVPDQVTLLTYAFFHGDFWHLAGNMLFLWVFGDNVEDSLGHLRYLLFYCLVAAAAGIAFVWSAPGSESPLIGASGAVAGIVAAYLILHPHAKVWVLVLARIPLRISALWILCFWILFQIYGIVIAGATEVAYWAHIGGFVSGAALVPLLRRPGVRLFDRGGEAG